MTHLATEALEEEAEGSVASSASLNIFSWSKDMLGGQRNGEKEKQYHAFERQSSISAYRTTL